MSLGDRGRLRSQSDATPAKKGRLVRSMASIVRLMVHFPSFRDEVACAVLLLQACRAAPRIAVQTLSGVIGTSRLSMSNGASASITACTMVGGAPIEPISVSRLSGPRHEPFPRGVGHPPEP